MKRAPKEFGFLMGIVTGLGMVALSVFLALVTMAPSGVPRDELIHDLTLTGGCTGPGCMFGHLNPATDYQLLQHLPAGVGWTPTSNVVNFKASGNGADLDFSVSPPHLNKANVENTCDVRAIDPLACSGDPTHDDAPALRACAVLGTYRRVLIPGGGTCQWGTVGSPRTDTFVPAPSTLIEADSARLGIIDAHTNGGAPCSPGLGGAFLINSESVVFHNIQLQNDNPATCVFNWSSTGAITDTFDDVRIKYTGPTASNAPTCLYMNAAVMPFTRNLVFADNSCGLDWDVLGPTNTGTFLHTNFRPNSSTLDKTVFNRGKPQLRIGVSGTPQGNIWIGSNMETGPNAVEIDSGQGNTFIADWAADVTPSNVIGYWTPGQTYGIDNWFTQADETTTGNCTGGSTTLNNLSAPLYVNEPISVPCGVAGAIINTRVDVVVSATNVTMHDAAVELHNGVKVYHMDYANAPHGCWHSQSSSGTTGAVQPIWPATPTPGITTVVDNGFNLINSGPCSWYYLKGANTLGTTIIGGHHFGLVGGVLSDGAVNTTIIGGDWPRGQYGFLGLGNGSFSVQGVHVSGDIVGIAIRGSGDGYRLGRITYGAPLVNVFDLGDTADGEILALLPTEVSGPDTSRWGISTRHTVLANETNIFPGLTTLAGGMKLGTPLVALGGGAAPTLGTVGGTGPVAAGQNSWVQIKDSTGASVWVPAWK